MEVVFVRLKLIVLLLFRFRKLVVLGLVMDLVLNRLRVVIVLLIVVFDVLVLKSFGFVGVCCVLVVNMIFVVKLNMDSFIVFWV